MSEQKKWIIGVLLAVLALCYYAYSSHREKKIDAFRSYVLGDQGKNSALRCFKRIELGLSQSEAAAVVVETFVSRTSHYCNVCPLMAWLGISVLFYLEPKQMIMIPVLTKKLERNIFLSKFRKVGGKEKKKLGVVALLRF